MEQSTKCGEIFHINGQLKYLCFLCKNYEENSQQFEDHFYAAHLKELIGTTNIKKDDLFCPKKLGSNSPTNIHSSGNKNCFEIVEIKEEFDDESELLAIENNKEVITDECSIVENAGTVLLVPQEKYEGKNENIIKDHIKIDDININIHEKEDVIAESLNLKCEYCNLQFAYIAQLQKHVWRFKELKYKCTECGKQICGPQLFKTHMKRHIAVVVKSRKRINNKRHVEDDDDEPNHYRPKQKRKPSTKLYMCDICKKVCREFCNLKTHMRLHTGEKPYACNQCDRRFNENSSLTMHIRHHHTKDRPFQCTECGACFGFLRTLNAHIRRCHEKDKDILTPCPICAKMYKGKRNLKNHIRTHSTERPYSCTQCNKTFKDRKILSQHSKLHTETKSYPCPFCDLSFAQWAGRRGHIRRMHEGK